MHDFTIAPHELKTPDVVLRIQKLNKAQDENTHPDVLDELADYDDNEVKNRVAANPKTRLETLLKLSSSGISIKDHPTMFDLVTKQFTGGHPLNHNWLIHDPDPMVASRKMQHLLHFAGHPETDVAFLRILSKHPNDKVLSSVLKNKNANSEFLFSLADHPSSYVRTIVARHPNSSPLLISKMVKKSYEYDKAPERMTLATNKNCPSESLDLMSTDPQSWIRRLVAKHPNTNHKSLTGLAFDKSPFVRISVAKNLNTPSHILMRMAEDDEPSVRFTLARLNNASGKLLEKLAGDHNEKVRYLVAQHPNTPSLILDRLAADMNPEVRKAVARNKNTSEQSLEKIRYSFKSLNKF